MQHRIVATALMLVNLIAQPLRLLCRAVLKPGPLSAQS